MSAVPVIVEQTGRPVVLVGGMAVLCRLSTAYRVTTDLDTVDRSHPGQVAQLELLLSAGAAPSGPSGAVVTTPFGEVQVDVLQVTDADLARLPEDPTDRLHVLAHDWAVTSASPVVVSTEGLDPLQVAVAEPGALVAMKLQAVMNRGRAKEGSDLLDIVRLTLDRECGPVARAQLERAGDQLRADALLHARRWFDDGAARSLRVARAVPEGRDVELDDLRLVGELLIAALDS
ncbi:prevent-host-death protein [Rhodococcus antarcticus]|uniref:Prevent-host-death protein n=1 Tax=Rhodococcus antarcticus TaxID=2987751 RepID=A0ABY6NYE1_9NOCA|nr:prevent-host-death protein [Rhodococcus antarcticus]UZJ24013.1 prevent-host-death protein [Rhodococcus antarcticus]